MEPDDSWIRKEEIPKDLGKRSIGSMDKVYKEALREEYDQTRQSEIVSFEEYLVAATSVYAQYEKFREIEALPNSELKVSNLIDIAEYYLNEPRNQDSDHIPESYLWVMLTTDLNSAQEQEIRTQIIRVALERLDERMVA